MPDTVTKLDFRTLLIHEAAIDGQTGTAGRHSPTRLDSIINRGYKALRSMVTQYGGVEVRDETAAAAIPGATAGEDYIELTWPPAASEIVGVDVLFTDKFRSLDRVSWAQRRWFSRSSVFSSIGPSGAPGWWAVKDMPQPSTTTTTGGGLVIWPKGLTGTFKIVFIPQWTPITDDTHVFVFYPDWEDWLLQWCTLRIVKRDNNKNSAFQAALGMMDRSEARIKSQSRRSRRGNVNQTRRDWTTL